MKNVKTMLILGALLWAGPAQAAARRLMLFGGGGRPSSASARFVELAGGESGRILFISWATTMPEEYFEAFRDEAAPAALEHALRPEALAARKAEFLAQLERATGVFLSGGDQNRVTRVLKEHPDLKDALLKRYRAGVVFASNSAGTAAVSKVMITGEGDFSVIDGSKVGTDEGLGLLEDAIVDQHFLARQRTNRLFGLVLARRMLGIGVDENAALLVEDERVAQAIGTSRVMLVRPESEASLAVDLLSDGQRYDLKRKRRL